MSASLVGSEMCIRDSFIWTLPRSFATVSELRAGILEWSSSDTVRTDAPVSYTHLTLPTICSV
eukprot:3963692-Alexandrium_andersonii.AAC.1